jgi:hypothetical protein
MLNSPHTAGVAVWVFRGGNRHTSEDRAVLQYEFVQVRQWESDIKLVVLCCS